MGKNTIWFILVAAVLVGLLAAWRMAFVLGYAPSDPATKLVNPSTREQQTTKAPSPVKQPPGPVGSTGYASNLVEQEGAVKGTIDQADNRSEIRTGGSRAPELTIDLERMGRQIVLRGKTDIPLESGSLTARAYRVYTSTDGRTARKVFLDTRHPPLEFETKLDTGKMVKASGLPEESLDRDKVYIEVEFVGPKADPGSVPGLSFAELGGNRRRYRIIRAVPLPLPAQAEAGSRAVAAAPVGAGSGVSGGILQRSGEDSGPGRANRKPTGITIRPLTVIGEKTG